MTAAKIMVIRHAEKPNDLGTVFGVTIEGHQDPEESDPDLRLGAGPAESAPRSAPVHRGRRL